MPALLQFTDKGIYCSQADVFIDPWKPVDKALITHGHADHSRWGHRNYLSSKAAEPVIRYRLGDISIETLDFGEVRSINGVNFSFHPAGHIVGSAQIRVEYKGEVWVASGDYKVDNDGISEAFEPLACHTFITESTFGLPVYKWRPQNVVFEEINAWWRENQAKGRVSVIAGYALGKAQRIIRHLDTSIGRIFTHGAIEHVNAVIRGQGYMLPQTTLVTPEIDKKAYHGNIVVATPSALASPWMRKFSPYSTAVASGWMGLRGARRRRSVDRGFVLSDHADWVGLNHTVRATACERVLVTHGYTTIFANWLKSLGLDAQPVRTEFEGELAEIGESQAKDEA